MSHVTVLSFFDSKVFALFRVIEFLSCSFDFIELEKFSPSAKVDWVSACVCQFSLLPIGRRAHDLDFYWLQDFQILS